MGAIEKAVFQPIDNFTLGGQGFFDVQKGGKQMAACGEKVCENHTQNIVGPDMTPDILRGMAGLELLKRVIKGEIPHPSMATTIPMKLYCNRR